MRQRPEGLTIVELILTIALVGILVIPTALIVRAVLEAVITSRDSSIAMSLARYELEQLDLHDFFSSPDLALGAEVISNYQGKNYTLTRSVTCTRNDNNCIDPACDGGLRAAKRIEVAVTHPGSGDTLALLQTIRTKYVDYGPYTGTSCP